jgi:hypothetical protein
MPLDNVRACACYAYACCELTRAQVTAERVASSIEKIGTFDAHADYPADTQNTMGPGVCARVCVWVRSSSHCTHIVNSDGQSRQHVSGDGGIPAQLEGRRQGRRRACRACRRHCWRVGRQQQCARGGLQDVGCHGESRRCAGQARRAGAVIVCARRDRINHTFSCVTRSAALFDST